MNGLARKAASGVSKQSLYDLMYFRRDGFGPAAELSKLRVEIPITRISPPGGKPAWLITRYADVRAVLADAARFGSAPPGFPFVHGRPAPTRLRRMLAAACTEPRLRLLRPRIEAIVDEHLDRMAKAGPPADLVPSFALPVPFLVNCELLGVPPGERARIDRESLAYLKELVARKRRNPDDSILSLLISQQGGEVSDAELACLGDLLLPNGHEPTASMLGIGTLLLLGYPGQFGLLRDDPGAVGRAVEELLRYLSVVNTAMPRTAVTDVTVAGKLVKAGETVFCSLSAADRDQEFGGDPDTFDVTRPLVPNVSFGHGTHYCAGAPLARLAMCIAYPALFNRFPNLQLAVPPQEVPFRASSFVHGLESLPVTW